MRTVSIIWHSIGCILFNSTHICLGGSAAKKAKTEPTTSLSDLPFDVKDYVRNNTVDKLKVDELKQVLKTFGVPVSNKKKADLVEDVYKNCKV